MKEMRFLLIATTFGVLTSVFSDAQLAKRSGADAKSQSVEFLAQASKKIDRLVGADFRRKQIRPLGKATDAEFLRRAYLNSIGRIPSYEEAVSFLSDENPDKRDNLIDSLLGSYGYNMHMFNWWADLLRATDEFEDTSGAPYIKWIKDSIAQNKSYKSMVHELISATGGGWQNGAVGYYVRDKGMLKDNMANTTRIFLGTRIECAQCHNHPFDSWKQMDFYQMAAFTNGIKSAKSHLSNYLEDQEDMDGVSRELRDVSRLIRYAVYDFSIQDTGTGTIRLPKDYKYRDGDPGERVGAKSLSQFGKTVKVSTRSKSTDPGQSRVKFADWLVSPDNPRFTKVIANRMWKRVMATGLFEPLDNFSSASEPSNSPLMSYLEELLIDLDYDLLAFQKILYKSYSFQLSPNAIQHPERSPYHFNGRQLKRLSAEQIWDSLLTLKINDPDKRLGNGYTGDAIMYRGRPVLVGKKSMRDLYNEVMALNTGTEVWDYTKELHDQIKNDKGVKPSGGESMQMMMAYNAGKKYGSDMRASELRSPMPNGHFLRQFGQSNREVIENSSTDSDVTQILSILNGHVERHLISNGNSKIFQTIKSAKSDEEKINRAFVSILSRYPSADEKEIFLEEYKNNGSSATSNMVSALISTGEFMFVQ
ncbi:MAG: DUF1549 domain-containing protein [Verrucomicrobiota bacterium]|nr:DUF1549 domain-containing protein [Verrucomicrobiota bacterium]